MYKFNPLFYSIVAAARVYLPPLSSLAQVDLERSLRDLEDTEYALKESRQSLRKKEEELVYAKENLRDKELENVRLSLDKVRPGFSTVRSVSLCGTCIE